MARHPYSTTAAGPGRLPEAWRPRHPSPGGAAQADPPRQRDTAVLPEARVARLEAVLWLADRALGTRKLVQAAGLTGEKECRQLVEQLRKRLATQRSALEVVEVAGGFRLMTRACYAPWVERLQPDSRRRSDAPRLSAAAAETLAVVAYRQPVVRAEIEAIRGVASGDLLRQLLEADLLRIVGRSGELGRPLLYGTTQRFLEVYGLGSLEALPGRDEETESIGPTSNNAVPGGTAPSRGSDSDTN